jgi:hypothetical protein
LPIRTAALLFETRDGFCDIATRDAAVSQTP